MSLTRKNRIILTPLNSSIVKRHREQLEKLEKLNKINRTSSSRTRKTLPSIKATQQHRKQLQKKFGDNKLDKPVIKKTTLSEQFKTQVKIGIQQATSSNGRSSRNKKPPPPIPWTKF